MVEVKLVLDRFEDGIEGLHDLWSDEHLVKNVPVKVIVPGAPVEVGAV